jgi:hypothetical protein
MQFTLVVAAKVVCIVRYPDKVLILVVGCEG